MLQGHPSAPLATSPGRAEFAGTGARGTSGEDKQSSPTSDGSSPSTSSIQNWSVYSNRETPWPNGFGMVFGVFMFIYSNMFLSRGRTGRSPYLSTRPHVFLWRRASNRRSSEPTVWQRSGFRFLKERMKKASTMGL